ncbi:unnamed protein product [Urochloa humidicola]
MKYCLPAYLRGNWTVRVRSFVDVSTSPYNPQQWKWDGDVSTGRLGWKVVQFIHDHGSPSGHVRFGSGYVVLAGQTVDPRPTHGSGQVSDLKYKFRVGLGFGFYV